MPDKGEQYMVEDFKWWIEEADNHNGRVIKISR